MIFYAAILFCNPKSYTSILSRIRPCFMAKREGTASIMFPFCLPVSQRTSASFSSSGTFASHPRDMM